MTYAVATERKRRLEELRDELRSEVRGMREVQVRVGRTLLEIQRSHNLLLLGSTSFPIFCEQEGLSPVEGRELRAMAEAAEAAPEVVRSEEHTSELQSQSNLVCRLLLEKKKKTTNTNNSCSS